MTSDAKIGLLLGLVFIFIIAFVINGLPRFRDAANGSELTTNMVSSPNGNYGITGSVNKTRERLDWDEIVGEPEVEEAYVEPEQTPVEQQEPEAEEEIRFKMKLPQDFFSVQDTSNDQVSESINSPLLDPFNYGASESAGVNVSQADSSYTNEPVYEPVVSGQTVPPVSIEVKKPKPVRPAIPKVYVVSSGDNLADIAKKFYGEVEGNRRVNIKKIFEANKNILESADQIIVGQKLVIPPLDGSGVDKDQNGGLFSGSLFEKVKSIGRSVTSDSAETKKRGSGKQYVVKDGDSLWKIAAGELGSGARYKEISELNSDILKSEDNLVVGMRLWMPEK